MAFLKIKWLIKSWLAKIGYFIQWVPSGCPTGISLETDLRRIINTRAPLVVDVGANTGQTINVVKKKFPNAKIVAFEASSQVCAQLRASHGAQCWKIFQIAIGERDGQQSFINYEKSDFSSLLKFKPAAIYGMPEIKEVSTEIVDLRKLDTILPEIGIDKIDLLKIDTQGNDLNVLRGATGLIEKGLVKRVLVEMNFFQMYEDEDDALSIMFFMKTHGFHLVDLFEKHRSGHVITWCTALFEHQSFLN